MDPASSLSPFDTHDYSRTSSTSEIDSPSDSDWLDISSSRESDDNDSVSSDSDRDRVDDLPPSRRSSISIGSSRDGDIEAWEGFADDSADEALLVDQVSSPVSHPAATAADVAEPTNANDVVEEQRVKDALDQSMISTLSASRSSSLGASGQHSTPHSSLRDLKLSFPDPLTSSRDELNASYGEVSPTETTFSATDGDEVLAQFDIPAPHDPDPDSFTTTEVPQVETTNHVPSTCYLDIILYGSSPAFKWTFIDSFVKKAAIGAGGRAVVLSHKITDAYTRLLRVQGQGQHENFSTLVVSVTDRTEFSQARRNDSSAKHSSDRPSLGVLYLPTDFSLPSSTDHDYYLPVLVHPSTDTSALSTENAALEAERIWDALAIPAAKTVRLNESDQSCILDSGDLDRVQPSQVQHLFERISAPNAKKSTRRSACQLTPVHTMTLLALLSVVLGFTINSALSPSGASAPILVAPSSSQLSGTFGPTANHSTTTSPKATNVNDPIISSMKDFALAVFNPATTSLSTYAKERPTSGRLHPGSKPVDCDRRQMTWSEKIKSSKDIITRPALSDLAPERQSEKASSQSAADLKGHAPSQAETVSSISLRIVDSLSPFFDVKMVLDAVQNDMKELMDTLDKLLLAINRQTAVVLQKSRGTAQVLREGFRYRNSRAKGKAKELRDMGGQFISFAEMQIRVRAQMAKAKARALREHYLTSVSWGSTRPQGRGKPERRERRKKKHGKRGNGKARKLFCGGF